MTSSGKLVSVRLRMPVVPPTEARVRAIERLRADLRVARIQTIAEGRAGLNPEQRTKLEELTEGPGFLGSRKSDTRAWRIRIENHGAAAYVVSKDAIRTFTRFVAEEEREWNICIVAFSPRQAIATEDAPEEARKRLPGPEILGNGFVLAAQASMDLTGKTVEHRDGKLLAVD